MEQVIRYIYQQVAEKQLSKDEAKTLLLELQKSGKTDAFGEEIAIVGMACKLPGADDVDTYWQNITNAAIYVRPIPKKRLHDFEVMAKLMKGDTDLGDLADQMLKSGYLDEVDKFDAGFFKVSPREAKYMEPLQRVFLETAWEAVESAGYGGSIAGTHTGIYVGKDHTNKSLYSALDTVGDPFTTTGSWSGILASRMAYLFNLTGPCVVVDSACSSGLVAVHLACKALQNKDCDMAIAGGIHLNNPMFKGGRLSMVESEDGIVRTFDKKARGTLWGEGCGTVVLKPLSKALADGDNIWAVIKGSAINNDGASNGITAPNAEAQEQVILHAWEAAKINPETVGYVEAHGTGTVLGDPIEIKGLTNAFRRYTEKKQFCGIGSVKPGIGHLVGAAGLASLMKTVLMLKNRTIPGIINFDEPNSYINFVDSPLFISGHSIPWEVEGHPRRAGVSAFGFSGTNAHVILEEAPVFEPTVSSGLPRLFTLSARSWDVLDTLIQRYAEFFQSGAPWNLDDLCYTATVGRGHYTHRIAILARDEADLLNQFSRLTAGSGAKSEEDGIFRGEHRVVSDTKGHREDGDLTEGERKRLSKTANLKLGAMQEEKPAGAACESALAELASFYVEGADPDWAQLYQGQKRRKLRLPIYPLERTRYWLEPEIPANRTRMSEVNEVGHPLFETCLAESMDQVIYGSTFAVESDWVLHDHVVAGSYIVPGTTYLEMARLAAERHYPEMAVDLRDVVFLTPLKVAPGEPKTVHTIVKITSGHLEFSIASKRKQGYSEWQKHVEGKIVPLERTAQAVLDLQAILERCALPNHTETPHQEETRSAAGGTSVFTFGPRWRNHQQVVCGEDEILVELIAAESARADLAEYGMHPALLDNAVNVASQREGSYLPLFYKSFKIYGPMPGQFYTYLKRKPDTGTNRETITYDISLCDGNGQIFASAENYALKRFNVNEWKSKMQGASRHYYEIGWIPAEPAATQGSLPANMLLLKDSLGRAGALQQKLEEAGVNLIEVDFGSEYRKHSDKAYTITGAAEDYSRLFGELSNRGIGAILHMSAITGEVQNLAGLKAAENRGIYSIFRLTQAYFANKFADHVDLILLTDRAHPVTGKEEELHPEQAALAAIGKSINAENSNLVCRTIDLDSQTDIRVVVQELITPGAPYQVAYRRGARWVEEFRALPVAVSGEPAAPVRDGGVYLITGGTGGLGLEFAKHFASQKNVRLALVNRSPVPDRSRWTAILEEAPQSKQGKQVAAIRQLENLGAEVHCFAADVADADRMREVFDTLKTRYGRINGIVHAAGIAGDGFIIRKSEETFTRVIQPKIEGTWVLHELSGEGEPEFLILFSSINSFLAGAGQSDYAAANAYLDSFAAFSNGKGRRTVAVNWPVWKETGMAVDLGVRDEGTLFKGITTQRGLAVFEELLSTPIVRAIPAELNMELMAGMAHDFPIRIAAPLKAVLDRSRGGGAREKKPKKQLTNVVVRGAEETDRVEMKLAQIWGNVLEVPELDIYDNFYDLGGDSLLATRLAKELQEEYPAVDISDIFSYPSVAQLAEYIKGKLAGSGTQMLEVAAALETPPAAAETARETAHVEWAAAAQEQAAVQLGEKAEWEIEKAALSSSEVGEENDIAIIGMACKLPGANDPEQYWENLKAGICSVAGVPAGRRSDIEQILPEELRSQVTFMTGGYLDEIDRFDAAFFGITPREAMLIDPVQRIFMQTAMEALEDAGYGGNLLYGTKTGVFVGRDHSNESLYRKLAGENDPLVKVGSWSGILASRLAYFMNFRGPAIVTDTACSSGLVSVHHACNSLRMGECTVALAGGVNLFSLPMKAPAMAGMESPDDVLRAFDAHANGTVWGEGVAAVTLKTLRRARADGDHIYAVIKGSAINNDGASNGLTAPSALAQEEVIVDALNAARVHPETIRYIEAHGTATSIGDPIEIKGITNAYKRFTNRKRFCAIGSVKTNIGHTVAASGIASLIKVALSLKNHGIPASLHYTAPNPHINFDDSPVYVNAEYRDWPGDSSPRRAAISAFGFSGTNAHMILEEAPAETASGETGSAEIITISARSQEVLHNLLKRYRHFTGRYDDVNLRDMAYTANTGRGHYGCRLALVVNSFADFAEKINRLAQTEDLTGVRENGVYYGEHKIVSSQNKTADSNTLTEGERRELSKTAAALAEVLRHAGGRAAEPIQAGLCDLYIQGAVIDWEAFYANSPRKRLSLPVYPFERKRFWVEPKQTPPGGKGGGGGDDTPVSDGNGASVREAGPEAVPVPSETNGLSFYRMRWIENREIRPRSLTGGRVLLFLDQRGYGEGLAGRLQASGCEVLTVQFGDAFAQSGPGVFTIAGAEEDYVTLLHALHERPLAEIIHLANVTDDEDPADPGELRKREERGIFSLYYLTKAIRQTGGIPSCTVTLIAGNGFAVTGDEDNIHPEHAAFYGLGKTVSREMRYLACRAVDIDGQVTVDALFAELTNEAAPYQVALRGNRRYIEELAPLAEEELAREEIPFDGQGVYLITGGMSGIGLEYAGYLAGQGAVNLALVGRSAFPGRNQWQELLHRQDAKWSDTIRAVQRMESNGATVECRSADVGSFDEMEAVITGLRKKFGRIRGIFHAAGVSGSGLLNVKEEADFRRVISPKMDGTWILDRLTRADRPDFFILCSSVISTIGGVGLADYTAANAYLDSFAAYRRKRGLPGLSINWAHWLETGMAHRLRMKQDASIFEGITTAAGHQYFAALTGARAARVIAAGVKLQIAASIADSIGFRLAPELGAGTAAGAEMRETERRHWTREEMEAGMIQIWIESFGIEEIAADADFFELGGNSLIAMVMTSKIAQVFGVTIALEDFLQYAALKDLVNYIAENSSAAEGESVITHVPDQEYYPTSSAQKRILVISEMEEGAVGYNMPSIVTVKGSLDLARFEKAFQSVIRRHESLRTSFAILDGEPVQIIHPEVEFGVTYQEAREDELMGIVRDFIRPFNLKKAPLMRVGLVKYAEDTHLLLFDMHHIISDGTSLSIISKEFGNFYNGKLPEPLPVQYRDYAVWQNQLFRTGAMQRQEEYWLGQFAGELPVLSLPTDYPRPAVMSFNGETLRFDIGAGLTEKIHRFAREINGTPYMVLLAAYTILLSKYAGQEDIIVGTPIAGRHHADLDKIVGMFVNSLVMRNYPKASRTVADFLNEVKENAFAAYENQDYPFEMLVDRLRLPRDLSRNPLFDTMFAMQNIHFTRSADTGLVISGHSYESKAIQFDLQLQVFEAEDHFTSTLEYSTALFKKAGMEQMIRHYLNIIESMVDHPASRIGDIQMISAEEREHLIYGLNRTAADFSKDRSIYRLFEQQAAAHPEKTALIFAAERVSYGELNERANRLARVLRHYGAVADGLVGILMERSPRMVESILAVWKAGSGYIPLDPEYPVRRLAGILNDSEAGMLITVSDDCPADLAAEYSGKILRLDTDAAEIAAEAGTNLNLPLDMNGLAYVIYTSGSTGKPKGAMVEHIGMMNHIQAKIHDLNLSEASIVAQNSSHCFDISVWQFFVALTLGGMTVIYPQEVTLHPQAFIHDIIQRNVTILEVVPSYLSVMLDSLEAEKKPLEQLAYLLVTGEIVKPNLVKRWFALYPSIPMVNAYGPTEASDDITHHLMQNAPEGDSIPIGRPVQNFHIYIVDPNMQLCPVGVKGEICVSGVGVGRGYLNNPEKTLEAFTTDPFVPEPGVRMYRTGDLGRWIPDGTIEFFGRKDYQVKIRGFRIELGEIETKLVGHPDVRESVVVDREDQNGNKYLCAYITVRQELDLAGLKAWLLESLPEYMVPAYFVILEQLPLNPNGKVDRKALPDPDGQAVAGTEYLAPRNEIEERLARIWSDVLGVEKVGVNDNFFEIGGNSIKLITLAYRINQEFGPELENEMKVIELFRLTTISQLAAYFAQAAKKEIQEYTL